MDDKRKTSLRLSQGKTKLIPRDINESLGKIPPQAPEMEIAVLGAIMLEKHAFPVVSNFLFPSHFYTEKHCIIYQAFIDLSENNDPIDMRTVINQLRKVGKIELVGGAFYIAELTSKISSAANIEYHARVIIDMSIKRQVIQLASLLHQKAYDDTTDPFDILDESIASLNTIHEGILVENVESRIKELWKVRQITERPEAEVPLIAINGVVMITAGNHSLIKGQKKSRKTLFITYAIQQFFLQNPTATADDVHLFDTEQGKSHVWQVREKIRKLTGYELPIFFLRGMPPEERRNFIKHTVKYWAKTPRIIVIDGVRDLMSDINNAIEATDVIVWLESLIMEHNVHIIEVLHENKGSEEARGHIGTELLNKAQVTIQLVKDKESGITTVKCDNARDQEFEPFFLDHGPEPDFLPIIVGMPVKESKILEEAKSKREVLISIFEDGPLSGSELKEEIKLNFGLSKHKTDALIREFKNAGWILKNGKINDPTAQWKCMISKEHPNLIPMSEAIAQTSLFSENGHSHETIEEDTTEDLPF